MMAQPRPHSTLKMAGCSTPMATPSQDEQLSPGYGAESVDMLSEQSSPSISTALISQSFTWPVRPRIHFTRIQLHTDTLRYNEAFVVVKEHLKWYIWVHQTQK